MRLFLVDDEPRMRRSKSAGQRGFALIWALIAMLLVSVLIFATVGLLADAAALAESAQESARQTRAADFALNLGIKRVAGNASTDPTLGLTKVGKVGETCGPFNGPEFIFDDGSGSNPRQTEVTCTPLTMPLANQSVFAGRTFATGGLVRRVKLVVRVFDASGASPRVRGAAQVKLIDIDPATGLRPAGGVSGVVVEAFELCTQVPGRSSCPLVP